MNFDMRQLAPYILIGRPDHWFKNIFMLPGMALGYFFSSSMPSLFHMFVGILSACLAASANYTINEYLDAPFDRQHPVKRNRPAALGLVTLRGITAQYIILALCAILSGFAINATFGAITLVFLLMGYLYNVPPFRSKDIPWLDVISESINNPIRFLLGWSIFIPDILPPSSFILAYWTGGAYLMTLKRYAEIKRLSSSSVITAYRKSLSGYSANKLLTVAIFYAMTTALFLGISLIKYKIELILSFPFIALLFSWYFSIALADDSVVQSPEKLWKERLFIIYCGVLTIVFCLLCIIDIPNLQSFLVPVHLGGTGAAGL